MWANCWRVRAGAVVLALLATLTLWSSYVPVPSRGRLDAVAPFTQLLALRPMLAVARRRRRRGRDRVGEAPVWRRRSLRGDGDRRPARVRADRAARAVTRRSRPALRADAHGPRREHAAFERVTPRDRRPRAADRCRRDRAPGDERGPCRVLRSRAHARRKRALARLRRPLPRGDDGSARPTSVVVRDALGPQPLPQPVPLPGAHGQVRLRLARVGEAPGMRDRDGASAGARAGRSQSLWRRDLLALRPLCEAAGSWPATSTRRSTTRRCARSTRRLRRRRGIDRAGPEGDLDAGSLGFLQAPIDHVMASGAWRATRSGVLRIEGSDHRAIWAELVRG